MKQTLEFFGIDKDDENNRKQLRNLEKTDNVYCRTTTGMSVWYRYTQSLKNCYTLLIPDRPYREMRWSDERKDKRCVHKKEVFPLSQNGSVRGGLSAYPAFAFGDGGSCDGACGDDTDKHRKSIFKISPFPTTSLIFMWIIAGRGFRGTGWTVSEIRCSTDFTALLILSGLSVYI